MAKLKISDEVRITQFFQTAPLVVAVAVLAICAAAVKARQPVEEKVTRARKVKALPNPVLGASPSTNTRPPQSGAQVANAAAAAPPARPSTGS